jgi:hypothetical protein
MLPAHQRFHSADATVCKAHLGLEMQEELSGCQGQRQIRTEIEASALRLVTGRREARDARVLQDGGLECGVGAAQGFRGVGPVARCQRYTQHHCSVQCDARCREWRARMLAQVQRHFRRIHALWQLHCQCECSRIEPRYHAAIFIP